jgi:hypothetical protein
MATLEETQRIIANKCDQIKELLLSKNRRYGNAALEPARIFSRADAVEQIKVRIDDKLNRIRNTGLRARDEDTTLDLVGYLVLLMVCEEVQALPATSNPSTLTETAPPSSGSVSST